MVRNIYVVIVSSEKCLKDLKDSVRSMKFIKLEIVITVEAHFFRTAP